MALGEVGRRDARPLISLLAGQNRLPAQLRSRIAVGGAVPAAQSLDEEVEAVQQGAAVYVCGGRDVPSSRSRQDVDVVASRDGGEGHAGRAQRQVGLVTAGQGDRAGRLERLRTPPGWRRTTVGRAAGHG